jgi:hypothetical protein
VAAAATAAAATVAAATVVAVAAMAAATVAAAATVGNSRKRDYATENKKRGVPWGISRFVFLL